jgi:hypothetical protein
MDSSSLTLLITPAFSAAGRQGKLSVSGIRGGTFDIDLLLVSGAEKGIQDKDGVTVYGHYKRSRAEYDTMLRAMTGESVHSGDPESNVVETKLMPPGGPSAADLSGERRDGIVDYSAEDREAEREMGRLVDSDDGDTTKSARFPQLRVVG